MKTVIFDIDGSIFDTKAGIIACLNDVLNHYGCCSILAEEQNKYIGPAIKDSLVKFNGFTEEDAINATKEYRQKYVEKYVEWSVPYNGLFELLSYIKDKKYNLCIATMKTRNQVERLLEFFNIYEKFDMIETAKYKGGYSKFDMLESIKSHFYDSDLYFVGDTAGDYKASLKADIMFVYASYGYGVIDEVNGIVIESLDDLKNIL